MNKIICDVCGTRYPESAEQCPICGCVQAAGEKTAADAVVMEEAQVETRPSVKGGRFSKSNVRKRNKNMARYEVEHEKAKVKDSDDIAEDFEEMEPAGKSNTVLNVLLIVVIIALLLVTGYIFVQYFLPGILADVAPTETQAPVVTEAPTDAPTEEPTVPCTGLELVNGSTEVVLTEVGQSWLLNIQAVPEDTTDQMTYSSSDEAVVTVDAQGTITAVGEGEAIVTVTCGAEEMKFNVACFFVNETEEPTEEPTEEETEEPTEAPTEEPTEPPLKDVKLEVNKTDMTFGAKGQQFQMKVKNGLTAQEVTWKSENESIVTVDENGLITCVGWGTTNIIATYGDQEVVIICRCK